MFATAGLAALLAFFIAAAPDPAVAQATLSCPGNIEQVLPSMAACGIKQLPGCSCFREPNVWSKVYWWAVPVFLGLSAAALLRSRWYAALGCLVTSVAIGGGASVVVLYHLNRMDAVQVLYSQLALVQLAVLASIVWAGGRIVIQRFSARRSASAA